jgi:hypothetical protein
LSPDARPASDAAPMTRGVVASDARSATCTPVRIDRHAEP